MGEQIRPFWSHYVTNRVNAIALFVDAAAPERLHEAVTQFAKIFDAARRAATFARLLLVVTQMTESNVMTPAEVYAALRSQFDGFQEIECAHLVFSGHGARSSSDALLGILTCSAND